jgi:hypothetical protein
MNYAAWLTAFTAREWWIGLKLAARELWDSLPGPWYVKVILIIACQLIPGQLDEIALIAVVRAWRKYKSRR